MVTQDTSPSGVAEVWDLYLFGRAKNRESGASDQEKQQGEKKPKNGYFLTWRDGGVMMLIGLCVESGLVCNHTSD